MQICPDSKGAYSKRTAITVANLQYKKRGVKLRVYPCGDHWHLTKKFKPVQFRNSNKHSRKNHKDTTLREDVEENV